MVPSFGQHEFKQRCAVRVSYSPNTTAGQWKAHGRYLARESATLGESKEVVFGAEAESQALATMLDQWQKSGDERLFKLIISPEFGDRLDLQQLTRELMTKMEADLGTRLEWVGTIHRNTEFPHVHVALRGVRQDGTPLRLDRTYIQHGIRANAQDAATAQIGYRTKADAQEAERREIHQTRFTSLDRLLRWAGSARTEEMNSFDVDISNVPVKVRQHALQSRLIFLGSMGLAEEVGSKWRVRIDFETVLRAMQRAGDRQRALAAHNSLLSDARLQSRVTDVTKVSRIEGRVLGHNEDETSGKPYMLIEGTDHIVHFVYHSPEINQARRNGELRTNSFIRIVRLSNGRLSVQDFGKAEKLLSNSEYLRNRARQLIKQGITPYESGVGGWLGKYEKALVRAVENAQQGTDTLRFERFPRDRGR